MKRFGFLFLTLIISSVLFAQEGNDYPNLKRNELKLNLPLTIFASYPELDYERLLNSDISVGASLGFRASSDQEYPLTFSLEPHFRWFFGGSYASMQKVAAGFFIELNSALLTRDDVEYYSGDNWGKKSKFGAGAGLAVGWKYVSKNNWVGEIYLGGGRDFSNSDHGYARVGVSIGKRF
ncbi:MAG: hypothetical protein BGN96_06370 [Bacteroidales bacterium 45-6]|nr:MAG: hypothetical protein BGN96_06370 [Bacteroidales bacterium 45-6]